MKSLLLNEIELIEINQGAKDSKDLLSRVIPVEVKTKGCLLFLTYKLNILHSQEKLTPPCLCEHEKFWQADCLELFLGTSTASYFELNLHLFENRYNYYLFEGYRKRIELDNNKEKKQLESLQIERQDHFIRIEICLDEVQHLFCGPLEVNSYYPTIIFGGDQYFAAANQLSLERPDFHQTSLYYLF